MAHEDIYWEDANNCFGITEWQARYPAQRYAYGLVEKTTYTYYYDEDSGDSWQRTQKWHWSYWAVLDWIYPDDENNTWTNLEHSLNNSMHRCISSTSSSGTPTMEGDSYNPLREQFVTRASTFETTFVQLSSTPNVIRSGNEYTFFDDYVYDDSELSPSAHEIRKEDKYSFSFEIENDKGDLWSLNSQGKLTLPQIHVEVLPNTDTPMPTEWRLDESGKLTMPVLREVVNDLGAFNKCQKLTEVIIPESVKSIGKKSFRETNLKSAEIASDCTYYETSFPSDCRIYFYGGGTITINSIVDMESHQIGRLVTMTINELEGN